MSGKTAADRRQSILALRARLAPRVEGFEAAEGEKIAEYRAIVSDSVQAAIGRLRRDLGELSGQDALCLEVAEQAGEYVEWLQWVFWDLPYFAVAMSPDRERFQRGLEACGLVYLAGRLVDDFMDRHFLYRGTRASMLAQSTERGGGHKAEALTVVAALLLCFEGLAALLELVRTEPPDDRWATAALEEVVAATRSVLVGAILEQAGPEAWNEDYYERLIRLKNVDYWRILWAALDPRRTSPLSGYLAEYYALAQRLNDVQEYQRDEAIGQPNLISIHRREASAPGAGESALETAEGLLADGFLDLAAAATELPAAERAVAEVKLAESIDEALTLGLFADAAIAEESDESEPGRLGLFWASSLEEFVERAGIEALEETACAVCGTEDRTQLFRRQGFRVVRCRDCGHVYVAPRLTPAIQARLGRELDGELEDPFLETQRIGAERLCDLLRRESAGPRMLDVGFGRGYLLRMARAYGFEAYGVETSRAAFEELSPLFGDRLHRLHVDESELPWGSFDVIVMSHVVEHLPHPAATLRRVLDKLNPDGLLYVAVPDVDSLQFRVFGKRWDAMNPVVHYQFFNQASLGRLLESAGFEVVRRIDQPPFRGSLVKPWMRLFRQLGGDESGELALLARRATAAAADGDGDDDDDTGPTT